MKKVIDLSREELDVAKFIYDNREKQENYKSYFMSNETFSILSELKRSGFISFLKLGSQGSIERVLLSNDAISYFKRK